MIEWEKAVGFLLYPPFGKDGAKQKSDIEILTSEIEKHHIHNCLTPDIF
jgi:hypothetical protein